MNRVLIRKTAGIKLDLGCGAKCKEGFVGLDIRDYGQEIVWDAENGIPLPDCSVCEIVSSHFMEHVRRERVLYLISEIWRVCANAANVNIEVPHSDSQEAHYPTHKSYWNEAVVNSVIGNVKGGGQYAFELKHMERKGISLFFELEKRERRP